MTAWLHFCLSLCHYCCWGEVLPVFLSLKMTQENEKDRTCFWWGQESAWQVLSSYIHKHVIKILSLVTYWDSQNISDWPAATNLELLFPICLWKRCWNNATFGNPASWATNHSLIESIYLFIFKRQKIEQRNILAFWREKKKHWP